MPNFQQDSSPHFEFAPGRQSERHVHNNAFLVFTPLAWFVFCVDNYEWTIVPRTVGNRKIFVGRIFEFWIFTARIRKFRMSAFWMDFNRYPGFSLNWLSRWSRRESPHGDKIPFRWAKHPAWVYAFSELDFLNGTKKWPQVERAIRLFAQVSQLFNSICLSGSR